MKADSTQAELEHLRRRNLKLAEDKAHYQLILQLIERLNPLPGLEDMLRGMLEAIVECIGGTNIKVYYWLEGALYCSDFKSGNRCLPGVDDDDVARVVASHEFVEQRGDAGDALLMHGMLRGSYTWTFPLLVGDELVGVIKLENLHVQGASLGRYLPIFCSHAALILSNEIRNFTRQKAERALVRSESRMRRLIKQVPIAMAYVTGDGRIVDLNDRFIQVFGYTPEELPTAEHWWPRAYPDAAYRQEVIETWTAALAEAAIQGGDIRPREFRLTCRNGDVRIMEISGVMLGEGYLATFVDLTERKRAEAALRRLNRELKAISECNQALMRAEDEAQLLTDICRIVREQAGYLAAWVGYVEHDAARSIRPIATAGTCAEFFAVAESTWADDERGQGPTGTAIRCGGTVHVQDFATDARTAPWRESAARCGYRSGIALPLKDLQSAVFGVLVLYSGESLAFNDDEIRLLEELAGDLAFGIAVLRSRAELRRAEAERQEHLRYFESMDRVNRAMQGTSDIEQATRNALEAVMETFACDRAYLGYPCDPEAALWWVPMECTRSEYPGVSAKGAVAMAPPMAETDRALLAANAPLVFGGEDGLPLSDVARHGGVKSMLAQAIRPQGDRAWEFGIQQCSAARRWSAEEMRLFQEIGRRLADVLTVLLAHRRLKEGEERFRLVFENSPVSIWEEDFSGVKAKLDQLRQEGVDDIEAHFDRHPELPRQFGSAVKVLDVNRAALAMHGAAAKDELFAGLSRLFNDESYLVFRRELAALWKGETELCVDGAVSTLAGERRHVTVYFAVCPGYEETLAKVFMSLIDITERRRAEERLRLAASVFANSQEGILISDTENRIIDVNPAFTRLTGYAAEEVRGRNPHILSAGRQSRQFYEQMWRDIVSRGSWEGELCNRRKSGEEYAEALSISAVRDERGRVQHYVGVFSDVSVLKAHEAELDHIAHFDQLTGVPNRRLLADRLDKAIARARRGGKMLAVCYLDLDGFKPINDQFGHEAGDRLLVEIAARLQACSRADDTLARLGGDEFVLLWNDIEREDDCIQALDRILQRIAAPCIIDGADLAVSASIGVTLFPEDDVDADSLLRHADHAMYSAKQLGKNRYQLFDARLEQQIYSRNEAVQRIARGLEADEFVLHYQPKVDSRAHCVIGVEALIRWQDPTRGLIGPKEFLPLIENDNLSSRVGRWVISAALRQARRWHEAGHVLPISINAFARHLRHPGFIDDVRQAIAVEWPDMPPHRLLIEIVETADLEDLDAVQTVITACNRLGIGFSLDDFGTGFSSLVHLRRLRIEELKIDQSFVRNMVQHEGDRAIVVGVIGLGGAFGLRVVAEGVETDEQARSLNALGCPILQGYGIGRPMPVEELERWLARFSAAGETAHR